MRQSQLGDNNLIGHVTHVLKILYFSSKYLSKKISLHRNY